MELIELHVSRKLHQPSEENDSMFSEMVNETAVGEACT